MVVNDKIWGVYIVYLALYRYHDSVEWLIIIKANIFLTKVALIPIYELLLFVSKVMVINSDQPLGILHEVHVISNNTHKEFSFKALFKIIIDLCSLLDSKLKTITLVWFIVTLLLDINFVDGVLGSILIGCNNEELLANIADLGFVVLVCCDFRNVDFYWREVLYLVILLLLRT